MEAGEELEHLLEELEDIVRENPVMVRVVLDSLGPEGLLVRYLLSKRGVKV